MNRKMLVLSAALALAALFLLVDFATAADINVMISGGYAEAYKELVPKFEQTTGNKIMTVYGPSMGETPQAIPNRIARGEPVDVVIGVGYAIQKLIDDGKAVSGSKTDLAQVLIYMAAREGAPKPDISTLDAFKQTLLKAKSIAYSDSASGVYISTEMLARLGIAEQVKGKSTMVPAEPVARVVARGDAEFGFQPLSALRPVPGIEIVGPIPPEVQRPTTYSAGIASAAKEPAAAKALIAFLVSPVSAEAVKNSGMDPIAPPAK
ncbi:MAG: substrate-binding domain-containing protein [Xanthobacteraceae bacterium]